MATNMAFQLQPPSSVGGPPQGAGETWVLNWFVWLCFIFRKSPDVYGKGCYLGWAELHFYGQLTIVYLLKTAWDFLDCNKSAQPIAQYNELAEHSVSSEYKLADGNYPYHSLKWISKLSFFCKQLLIANRGHRGADNRLEAGYQSIGGHTYHSLMSKGQLESKLELICVESRTEVLC